MIHSEICCQGTGMNMKSCSNDKMSSTVRPFNSIRPDSDYLSEFFILFLCVHGLPFFSFACLFFYSFHLHAWSSFLFICMPIILFFSVACIYFFLFICMHGFFSFHLNAWSLFFLSARMVFFSCHLHALSSFLFI